MEAPTDYIIPRWLGLDVKDKDACEDVSSKSKTGEIPEVVRRTEI